MSSPPGIITLRAAVFLFDTDTITNVLKPKPSPALLKRLAGLDIAHQFVSAITVAEIVYGACKSTGRQQHIYNLEHLLLPNVNVLDFDCAAAYVAGEIRADLDARGRPLAFVDIQIAATALAHDLTLVTGNTQHFDRINDLQVEDWM